jgi:hypothetical protein
MQKTKTIKIIALIFSGLVAGIILLFLVAETVGGDWSGLGHLVQLIPVVLLMWLGWKRPLWGGILLLALSAIAAYTFANPLNGRDWLAPLLIIVAPLTLAGLLFLGAVRIEKSRLS